MEPNGLPGGLFSGLGSGMLGLEMPLHQNPQNPNQLHQPQMVAYAANHEAHPQSQQVVKHGFSFGSKSKQQLTLSDDEEPGFNGDDSTGDGKKKMSPWQRMKWTDSMVRLLIMAVYYIGDEGGSDGNDPSTKKKGGGLLQKKGKWKSVSAAMMDKGFYVSPQQCEDKFNDLNKRYKRVNDILGKGTACRVVENQSLLETMDLSPKMKEEVRKLLNSKHLFFREMCAYHNSCGHGTGGGGGAGATQHSPEVAAEPSHMQRQQQCFHSSEHAQIGHSSGRTETEGSKMTKGGSGEECEEDEDDEEDDDSEEGGDEDDAEVVEGGHNGQGHGHGHDDEDENYERSLLKRPRTAVSQLIQQLSSEMMSVIQDGGKSVWEKRHWMKSRLMQLEEQQVSYQCQGMELEKQRLKWVKFSSKKEREMERAKIVNEKRKLENERMVLLIRQKEFELHDFQQQHSSNKRGDPSTITG